MIKGNITSLVTPMKKNLNVDYDSLKKIIYFQLKNKIKNIILLGTTGESSTLRIEEKIKIIEFSKKIIKKKSKIIVGNCSNSTEESIIFNKILEEKKIDAILQIVPYYNNPNQRGIYEHFKSIVSKTSVPIIIYNVPKRTSTNISEETIRKISKFDNVLGIKNSYNDVELCLKIIREYKNKKFRFYCGDDIYFSIFFLFGATGNISVASNIIPKKMNKIYYLIKSNKNKDAIHEYFKIFNLIRNLFIDTNPIPVKWILSKMNIIKNNLRLPLTKLKNKKKIILKKTLLKFNDKFFKKKYI
ncbi:4-hydroxy-tetrahydrodipicolinate synthase [Candidatus Vidania fulgoroideorum]